MWLEYSSNVLQAAPGAVISELPQVLSSPLAVKIPASWHDVEYREAVLEAEIDHGVAWQVRINREERGLSQAQLASMMGTGQSAVSKLEDPTSGDLRLSTLTKVAHAFKCALIVRFVSYSDFAATVSDVRPDRLLACDFESDVASFGGLCVNNSQIESS